MKQLLILAAVLWAASSVRAEQPPGDSSDDCARHLNRLLSDRVGWRVRGNAWDLQLLAANRPILELRFRVRSLRYRAPGVSEPDALVLARESDRALHFAQLYEVLDRATLPVGVVGFVYRFSSWRAGVQALSRRSSLPQTHVAFLDGRKRFTIVNSARAARSLGELLGEKIGVILGEERELVQKRIGAPLWLKLAPGARHEYTDYLLRQHFVRKREGALLEMLRKLPADRKTPIFRPVSFSLLVPKGPVKK